MSMLQTLPKLFQGALRPPRAMAAWRPMKKALLPFKGAVLVYSPSTKKVRLRPLGALRFPAFTLAPENHLVRSSSGHRVDRSDIGALLQNVKELQERGATEVLGEETVEGRDAKNALIEMAVMDDLQINPAFPDDFFIP